MVNTEIKTTEAGQKFLELYAEPIVTNTYLKVAILVLAIVSCGLLFLTYRAQQAALHVKPLILSVTDMGRGQVQPYNDFHTIPVERVSKYYLGRWASLWHLDKKVSIGAIQTQQTCMTPCLTKTGKQLSKAASRLPKTAFLPGLAPKSGIDVAFVSA